MKITDKMTQSLAENIAKAIKQGFERVHLSGNLMNTMQVTHEAETGFSRIFIPAVSYDIERYIKTKEFITTPQKGSYANELEEHGSHFGRNQSGHHKGYVEEAVNLALPLWAAQNRLEIVKVVYSSHYLDDDARVGEIRRRNK